MNVNKTVDVTILSEQDGIIKQKLYNDPRLTIMHITLEPGACLKAHSAPVDVVFYVLDGEGLVTIGDETQEVCRDSTIESPKNIIHGLENNSKDKIFRVMIVKIS